MKGRKPGISRIRRAFLIAAATFGMTAGTVGIDNLPKEQATDTHSIVTYNIGTADQYGYNISPVDQFWKQTLGMKSEAQRNADLLNAAIDGDSWRVKALLNYGIDTETAGAEAMARGAGAGHADVVNALLQGGVKADAQVNAALIAAANNNHTQIALDLLNAGANAGARSSDALISAAGHGNSTLVNALLSNGADANAQSGAAFLAAAGGGYTGVVDALLSAEKTIVIPMTPIFDRWDSMTRLDRFENQHIPPHLFGPPSPFSFDTNYDIVKVKSVNVDMNNGQALYDAVYRNDTDMARTLMKHGANAEARSGDIKQLANESRNTEMVKILQGDLTPSTPFIPPFGL